MRLRSVRISNFKSFVDSGDVDLGQINVLVGRNNSGKSAFIQAVQLLQSGVDFNAQDIRILANEVKVRYELADIDLGRHFPDVAQGSRQLSARGGLTRSTTRSTDGRDIARNEFVLHTEKIGVTINNPIPQDEPRNFIYPYLSKRKVTVYDPAIDVLKRRTVLNDFRYLVSKIAWLANPDQDQSEEYSELCRKVLGFRISAIPADGGMRAGIPIGSFDEIYIEDMGEGVPNVVGLIVDLCRADGNLFLIEELENDIHPEGLKALLEVIIDKSKRNQFIVSTHSNIVTKYLGAAPDSRILAVELTEPQNNIPTSIIREVEPTPQARLAVLRQLGYELFDFDLWNGWLILEESSAERIIRDVLIPRFVPRLTRIRSLAAGGTSKAEPTFEDFRRLFVFAHLEITYHGRAWVVLDGDDSGAAAVAKLRSTYAGWPADRFRTWSQPDFERYYPERFSAQVEETLSQQHGEAKRAAKKGLLKAVIDWSDEEPQLAMIEFADSAAEVIAFLREVDQTLFGDWPHKASKSAFL